MNVVTKTFKTYDLYIAAFLKTAGFSLTDIEKNGKQKIFVFEDNGLIAKTQTEYFNGISKVVAKDLIDNLRTLKALINME